MANLITFLNTISKSFVDFSSSMLVQSSVLIIVLLVLDLLLRKKVRAVFRYCIWMLVLIKLVLPTTLSSPTGVGYWFGDKISGIVSEKPFISEQTSPILPDIESVSETVPSETAIAVLPSVSAAHEPVVSIPAESAIAASSATVSLSRLGFAFLAWLTVVAAMTLLLVQRMFFVRGLLAQSKNPNYSMVDIFKQCRKQMKIHGRVNLKLSQIAASPSVCGLFRPTILIPQNLPDKLKVEDLRAILLHELAHIKRGDLWVSLVQTILQIAYFYNPLLWLANAIIRKVREQAVDEMVLAAMGEQAEDYPETLLNISRMAFSRPVLSLRLIGVVESKKALSGRIKHILSRPFPKTAKLGFIGLIAIIITASILLPMARAQRLSSDLVKDAEQSSNTLREVVDLTFANAKDLNQFVFSGGEWSVKDNQLLGTCQGDRNWASYKTSYKQISSVTIRGGIVLPSSQNLRIWVGPIHLIFNWEQGNQNHYRNNTKVTATSPHELTPGQWDNIKIEQQGNRVIVTVDERQVYSTEANLQGTISVQAAHGSTIAIEKLRIVGQPDDSVTVEPVMVAIPEHLYKRNRRSSATKQLVALDKKGPKWVPSNILTEQDDNFALEFDGSNDYIKIPASDNLNLRSNLTLSAWVKNNGDYDGQIIWRGDSQGGKDPYELHLTGGKMEFRLDVWEGNMSCTVRSKEPVDSNWHFWTGVYDSVAKTMYLYKDAQLENTAEVPVGFKYDTSKMWNMIGAVDHGNWQHFAGTIDEVRIWNVALVPEQIQQNMTQAPKANETYLMAYWKFDKSSGQYARDVTQNRNDGKLAAWQGRIGYISPRYQRQRSSWNGQIVEKLAATDTVAQQQPYLVGFEITKQGFLINDWIEITKILGPTYRLQVGQTYTIKGKYKLSSRDEARLHLYATNGETRCKQGPIVKRGTGEFTRTFTYLKEGWLHLSFYPAYERGSSLGNLYFAEKGSNQQVPDISRITSVVGGAKPSKQKPKGATMLTIEVAEDGEEGPKTVLLKIPLAVLDIRNTQIPEKAKKQMDKYGITLEKIAEMFDNGVAPMVLLEVEEEDSQVVISLK